MSIRAKLIVNQDLFRNVVMQNPNSNGIKILKFKFLFLV